MTTVPHVPDRGDIVLLNPDPQAGHEQAGCRPALIVSPRFYNQKVGLVLLCPITNQRERATPSRSPAQRPRGGRSHAHRPGREHQLARSACRVLLQGACTYCCGGNRLGTVTARGLRTIATEHLLQKPRHNTCVDHPASLYRAAEHGRCDFSMKCS